MIELRASLVPVMTFANITSNVTIINDMADEISGPYSSYPARKMLQDTTSDIIIAHFFLAVAIICLVVLQGTRPLKYGRWAEPMS